MEGLGAYSISKHAMVAYTNTLRLEMKKWGVSVSLVEPMGFNTGSMQEHVLQGRKEEIWSALDEETRQVSQWSCQVIPASKNAFQVLHFS